MNLNEQFSANIAAIAQQAVINSQNIAHHTQTQAINQANSLGPFDMVGLAGVERASRPNDFAALSTSHGVPNVQART